MKIMKAIQITLLFFWCAAIWAQDGEWKEMVRGSIVLCCHKEDMDFGNRVILIAERFYPQILDETGLSQQSRITILLTSSAEEFGFMTEGRIPEWGMGAADPGRGIIFLKSSRFNKYNGRLQQVVVHELSHVVLGRVLNTKSLDRWFEEGWAMVQSGEGGLGDNIRLARGFISGETMRLEEINDVLGFGREKAALAYEESRSAVDYFIHQYGREGVVRLIRMLEEGMGMEKAIPSVTGLDFNRFQDEWMTAMKRRYRLYFFLDFPFILSTLFVILFLLAFFSTRRRINKKKKAWEKEDEHGIEAMEENSTQD